MERDHHAGKKQHDRRGLARFDRDRAVVGAFCTLVALPLLVFVAYPLWSILGRSFVTPEGLGLANYGYFGTARAWTIVGNTVAVALTTTAPAPAPTREQNRESK